MADKVAALEAELKEVKSELEAKKIAALEAELQEVKKKLSCAEAKLGVEEDPRKQYKRYGTNNFQMTDLWVWSPTTSWDNKPKRKKWFAFFSIIVVIFAFFVFCIMQFVKKEMSMVNAQRVVVETSADFKQLNPKSVGGKNCSMIGKKILITGANR